MEVAEIETAAETMSISVLYHLINDVLGFLLYMHQQIPSSDIGVEFDMLQSAYTQLEAELASTDLKASIRRKHNGRSREVRQGIRRLEKLVNAVSSAQVALKLVLSECPGTSEVILILGSSPLRPQYVYELCFLHGNISLSGSSDYSKCRAAEVLSKRAIRMLISKGVGSRSYPGCTKLFIFVKAPSSFNQPLHYLPKREFKYNKKIVPFRLRFKCRAQDQVMDKLDHQSETGSSECLGDHISTDLIWFQCRHVIKGLVSKATLPEE
ncbi:hypothetical protein CDL15_Pgr018458 [Punica granatum]|uniref:Uncharacterized protein n=1 Tax=Punica granatum TaxID=22663 RepID=A0A218WZE5_PUNGR|nr:hypothetical protein CDL15_Pgr018458 [Punica granatum]